VYRVGFSPDGRRLFSRSGDRTERVWDVSSGRCLGVNRGGEDSAVVDPGNPDFPWQAIPSRLETAIKSTASGEPVAWFPLALMSLAPHSSGRTWAGASANDICLFTLEGTGEPGSKTAGG
jgi:hypothetical protein